LLSCDYRIEFSSYRAARDFNLLINRIFSWLHHANVDRIFTLWQSIFPHQYLAPMTEGPGTFALPPGTLDTQSTPLEPFSSNGQGKFYNSASSWKTSTFGYTYPEIQDWNQTPAQLKQNVSAIINRMYHPQGTFSKRGAPHVAQTKEWSVALNVSKYDLQGERFIVRVFLGQAPKNQKIGPSAADAWARSLFSLLRIKATDRIRPSSRIRKLL
jgi:tyrosinase